MPENNENEGWNQSGKKKNTNNQWKIELDFWENQQDSSNLKSFG